MIYLILAACLLTAAAVGYGAWKGRKDEPYRRMMREAARKKEWEERQ